MRKENIIMWHNMIEGKSVKEILKQTELIVENLKTLLELEKEKKITLEQRDTSPSMSEIIINDESVRKEVEQNDLVMTWELEDEE